MKVLNYFFATGDRRVPLKKLAASDTAKHNIIALPVIMFFEVLLTVKWFIDFAAKEDPNPGYLAGYVALSGLSVLALVFCILGRKKIDTRWKWVGVIQSVYAVGIVAWALAFTHIDAIRHTTFSPIINITIVTIVPVFTFLNPFLWLALEVVDAVYIVVLWSIYIPNNSSFLINYIVFALISIIASFSLYLLRFQAYSRELLLKDLADAQKKAATTDALTGLLNRRAYEEEETPYMQNGHPDDLVIVVCDINGLKLANDTKGHDEGDLLIKTSARLLQETFADLGTIYRTGGDEFIGILRGSEEQVNEAIDALHEAENSDALPEGLVVSIAIGYAAAAKEKGKTFHDLEVEADEAMYQDKQKYHRAR